ncbi:MAG: glycosyltransferase family 39 protein [Planctomycetes bacterium]|nr:glycosyltransferase family 39 protein [Planctomycetota bacterium]
MIASKSETKPIRYKEDEVNLIILLFIASLLGIYLITTTVLIAQDGIFYIERAQKLSIDPRSVIISHPPGYPFLIFIALKFVGLFNGSPSAQTLAYTAQSITLLCRLLAIIPLYFIGKLFVGSRNSFWALLILILLPYPANFGSDVLRDWPHILFLAVGFLFLLWGVEQGKLWFLGITGLVAGLGYTIRPECAQLVLYGIVWLCIQLLKPNCNNSRAKLTCALFILLIGFVLPMAPYVREREGIAPLKLRQLFDSPKAYIESFSKAKSEQEVNVDNRNSIYSITSIIIKAFGRLIGEISENLMYFFLPALLYGFYFHFNKNNGAIAERFFMPVFILLNVIMMILLRYSQGYISRRHCLPLIVFSIFYVPIGLQVFAEWLSIRFPKGSLEKNPKPQLWFFILVAVGVAICLPKLIRPLRVEKRGYREVAKWLKENTAEEDLIAVPDHRIGFYAERDITTSEDKNVSKEIDYIVSLVKDENEEPEFSKAVQKKLSLWVDKRRKKYKLIIYEVL